MNEAPSRSARALRVVVPLSILAAGIGVAFAIAWLAPTTEQREETRPARIVNTVAVQPTTTRIAVSAYGTVIPARRVTIEPQVRGLVVRQHEALVPGGYVSEGEELVGIDPADYELTVVEQEAALEEAEYEIALERGRQVVASREWRLLEGDLPENEANRSLVLREPHLARTEALVRKAENEIDRARLDLSRTSVVAPFNAVVLDESVETGQLVESGTPVATLVGTDEFWVRVSVPVEKLRWIALGEDGSEGAPAKVLLKTGEGAVVTREGRVMRLLSDLEPDGRMARLVVSVRDPLGLRDTGAPTPLLLGSYVRVEIDAGELSEVISVPRFAMREDSRIWLVGADNRLIIRPAHVVWNRPDTVLIENCIEPGELLVVSGLRVALPGMVVKPQPADDATASPEVSRSEAYP